MVRMGGLEPPRTKVRRILSPLRLPIPPHPHIDAFSRFQTALLDSAIEKISSLNSQQILINY